MKYILLNDGTHATVDDIDYDSIKNHGWYKCSTGAVAAKIQGKKVYLHRLIMKSDRGYQVDHINHNQSDNTRANLRICTLRQNTLNRRSFKNGTSKYKGVYIRTFASGRVVWRAKIRVNGKNVNIGHFDIEEDAAIAYNKEAVKYFGEFAWLNPV